MSRKHRRDNAGNEPSPQNPPPPPPQQPAAAASARPWLVLTVVLGLGVLVAGVVILTLAASGGGGVGRAVVIIDTSEGPIKAELYGDKAPITVKNFLGYVDEGFYDGTIWHRVMRDFMIQGGGFEPGLREKKEGFAGIKNESYNGLRNERGTLAMARTPDPDSARAQFFINLKPNTPLDRANAQDGFGYAVFGKVIEGMDVVDRIAQVPVASRGGHEAVPLQDVMIKSIRRVETKKAP